MTGSDLVKDALFGRKSWGEGNNGDLDGEHVMDDGNIARPRDFTLPHERVGIESLILGERLHEDFRSYERFSSVYRQVSLQAL